MEAVVAIIKNLLRNPRVSLILGVVLGLILGLIVGWGLWHVQWTDALPEVLRADLQEDYMRMAIDSYRTIKGLNPQAAADLAIYRWDNLGTAAGSTYGRVQANPSYLDQVSIQDFGVLLQSRKGGIDTNPPVQQTSTLGKFVLYAAGAVLVVLLAAGGLYLYRLLRKGPATVTAVMQAAEASKSAEKTDFQALGLAPPITQTMTTYVLGDDLYDESFSIDTGGGEFLGEYGVGVSETIGVGEPKKVAALEIWLLDKNDIKTAAAINAVVAAEERLDILVNNAGISVRMPVEEYPVETWDEMMAVNVRGTFLGIKHCVPIMKAQRAGNIIVMSSIAGLIGHRHSSIAYIACKGALTMLTKGVAVQYAAFGIRANSIHPSTVDTPLTAELFRNPEKKQQRLAEIPMGGLATVQDIAAAALFLASDDSRFVTGIALPVDGGLEDRDKNRLVGTGLLFNLLTSEKSCSIC